METGSAVKVFKGLGHPVRLGIYKRLLATGSQGLTVGELHKEFKVSASTFSRHITCLVIAGLVRQTREGKKLRCVAEKTLLWDSCRKILETKK